jgi:hypothetical protein
MSNTVFHRYFSIQNGTGSQIPTNQTVQSSVADFATWFKAAGVLEQQEEKESGQDWRSNDIEQRGGLVESTIRCL